MFFFNDPFFTSGEGNEHSKTEVEVEDGQEAVDQGHDVTDEAEMEGSENEEIKEETDAHSGQGWFYISLRQLGCRM